MLTNEDIAAIEAQVPTDTPFVFGECLGIYWTYVDAIIMCKELYGDEFWARNLMFLLFVLESEGA